MKHCRVLLPFMLILFVLASGQSYAYTPDRGLENPVFLADLGDSRVVYIGYATGTGQFVISYAEYDEFADGYGAFTFESGGKEGSGTISFTALKEYGDTDFGFGLYRGGGVTSFDIGASHRIEPVYMWVGVHAVPLTKWSDNKDQINVSLGASVNVIDSISVGVDARSGDAWQFGAQAKVEITPDIAARLRVGFRETNWQDVGANVWVSHNQILVHVGYTYSQGGQNDFQLGLGYRF